jgi:Mycobacterial 4 TMS phage holin, superfamily IV
MIRMLVRAVVFLVSAAVGLLVAAAVVDGVAVSAAGLLVAVVVFAVLQSVLAPFLAKVAARNAPAFLGGIGLVSTFVALLAASALTDALTISGGVGTWVAATVVVWLATAVATLALPVLLAWFGLESRRSPA